MIDLQSSAWALLLGVGLLGVEGCHSEGRPFNSNCTVDWNLSWVEANIHHYLDTPDHCPIAVAGSGQQEYYSATAYAPGNTIADDWLSTDVFSYAGDWVGTYSAPWYYPDLSGTLEADVDFAYYAGAGTPVAGEFQDRAANYTVTVYNLATATVHLTYRKGAIATMVGPLSPTPGTNGTWSLGVQNATAPYSYRWFKDGTELSGQTSSSITLPVTTTYFDLQAIVQTANDGADTLEVSIAPSWRVTIYGMSSRAPGLTCNYASDTGTDPSGSFTYQWILDGSTLPDNGSTANPTFSVGSHNLELVVTDANGYTASTSMVINVSTDGPSNCE
jgi:hypothetical protein